jgi:hypothetical protein
MSNRFEFFFGVMVLVMALGACEPKRPDVFNSQSASFSMISTLGQNPDEEELVGVYFMPSWNTSPDPAKDRDSFWSCLQDPGNCSNLLNPSIWGPKGRIYNAKYPYQGPYLDRKPIAELKGFYSRTDPEVARKQLQYMKRYGIDFFAYDWFFGRHYFHHQNFAPQAKIYYPKGWATDQARSGRVAVPGMIEWGDQLEVLLAENARLPKGEQMKFAINWCDDSDERWKLWLKIGSPEELARQANYEGEKPSKELYLKVHEKITQLWIDLYFSRDDYLKGSDGRPVVYFYFPQDAESRAAYYGLRLVDLLELSQKTAQKAGLPGIKFIAVMAGPMLEHERMYGLPTVWKPKNPKQAWQGGEYQKRQLLQEYVPRLKGMGFEGMTSYVYHNFMDKDNRSYADMRATYRGHWKMWSEKFKNDPNFEYQVPVAMGWDMRPAGGTWPQPSGFPSEPYKDLVHSDKTSFKAKLKEAQQVSRKYRQNNGNTVMICCWNEYLEGNYIEPTVGHGFSYLEAIQEVFGDQ